MDFAEERRLRKQKREEEARRQNQNILDRVKQSDDLLDRHLAELGVTDLVVGTGVPLSQYNTNGLMSAKVTKVLDGDTIEVDRDIIPGAQYPRRLRFNDVDAPELDQLYGPESRDYLEDRALGKEIEIQRIKEGPHGRPIGRAYLDGTHLGEELASEGLAWDSQEHYGVKDPSSGVTKQADLAQQYDIGLWQSANPTPPWDWRDLNEDEATGARNQERRENKAQEAAIEMDLSAAPEEYRQAYPVTVPDRGFESFGTELDPSTGVTEDELAIKKPEPFNTSIDLPPDGSPATPFASVWPPGKDVGSQRVPEPSPAGNQGAVEPRQASVGRPGNAQPAEGKATEFDWQPAESGPSEGARAAAATTFGNPVSAGQAASLNDFQEANESLGSFDVAFTSMMTRTSQSLVRMADMLNTVMDRLDVEDDQAIF